MYRNALAVFVLLTLPSAIEAESRFINSVPVGYAFGKSYTIVVTGEEFKKTPAWDEAHADNPPLSARKALKLATDFRKTLIPGHADWEWRLDYLALRTVEGRWYWLAHFEAFKPGYALAGLSPHLYVAVLMDGTVVKPHIENDRPYRR